MKILYIHKKNFTQFLINNLNDAQNCDVIVFAPGCFKLINIDNELNNISNDLLSVCHFSRVLKATIIIFCKIKLSKISKITNGALIIFNGKLLGICEEIDVSTTNQFASVNIYEVNNKRICVLVGDNSKMVEFMQIASIYNCEIILCGVEKSCRAITSLGRYFLDINNINCLVCSKNKLEVFSSLYKKANKKNLSIIDIKCFKLNKIAPMCKYLHKTIYENFNPKA